MADKNINRFCHRAPDRIGKSPTSSGNKSDRFRCRHYLALVWVVNEIVVHLLPYELYTQTSFLWRPSWAEGEYLPDGMFALGVVDCRSRLGLCGVSLQGARTSPCQLGSIH